MCGGRATEFEGLEEEDEMSGLGKGFTLPSRAEGEAISLAGGKALNHPGIDRDFLGSLHAATAITGAIASIQPASFASSARPDLV